MLPPEFSEKIVAAKPEKGAACDICGGGADQPAVVGSAKVLLKTFRRRVCLECSSEIKDLLDLRIAQAKKGEFQA